MSTVPYFKKALHAEALALGRKGDLEGLLNIARRHSRNFTQVDCAIFLQSLEYAKASDTQQIALPTIDKIVTRLRGLLASDELEDASGRPERTLSSACSLFYKLGFSLPHVPVDEMVRWDTRQTAQIAWAYAKAMQAPPDNMFESIAKDVQERYYNPRCASNVAWALATVYPQLRSQAREKTDATDRLERVVHDALAHITDLCLHNKPEEWSEHDVGNLCWATATFPSSNRDRLYASIAQHAKKHNPANYFNADGLIQVANALTRACHADASAFVESAAQGINVKGKWGDLNARHFANLLWSLGKNRMEMTPEFWKEALSKGPQLQNAQDCVNVVWTLARVDFRDEETYDKLALAAQGFIDDFTPQGLANIAWAFNRYEGSEKQALTKCLVARCVGLPVDKWSTRTLTILGRQLPAPEVLTLLCNDFWLRPDDYSDRDVMEVRLCVRTPVPGLDESLRRSAAHLSQEMSKQIQDRTRPQERRTRRGM
eukprot:GEMP01046792.1.p1 GENE.GEMP01046792.1~~GEMP01046792.1.p1  ORF type:complete len:487 (+),score=103.04 GEMP01046792.1:53-1513(+)